jgi:hypothetical protein
VVIETPEKGATVHYTLNGSTPTERSQVYTKPFDLSSSATVKAIAVMDGMDSSAVREAKIRLSNRDSKPGENHIPNDTDNALSDVDKVTEDAQNDINDQDEQDLSFFENFEGYSSGQDPTAWRDTEGQNSMKVDQQLFATAQVDGTRCLGTTSPAVNIHTHYQGDHARNWTNYSFSGRMYLSDTRGGLGVTFFSQYIGNQDRYYRLRRYNGNGQRDFHLSPHGTSVSGDTHSGVEPQANTWYQFYIVASDTGSKTVLQAKVWKDGTAEPSKFQIEATDTSSNRLRSGTIGLWSMRDGTKCFDQLKVR